MKIRKGFVSNSSSSNFIIFGKTISIDDIKVNVPDEIIVVGIDLGDGLDIFDLTPEICTFILLNKNSISMEELSFIRGWMCEGYFSIRKEELLKFIDDDPDNVEYTIENYYSDYASTDSLETFKERYLINSDKETDSDIGDEYP